MKKVIILTSFILFIFSNLAFSQSTASFGVTYSVLSADAGGAGTNSTCYIVPTSAAPLITWSYSFSSAPASVTMQLQGSDTNCSGTFISIDSGTTTTGEIRFLIGAPKAIRIQINAKSGGGTTTATFNFTKYTSYVGGVLTRPLRAANGTSAAPGLSFYGNLFDGFYWLSTGQIVYTGNGNPVLQLGSSSGLEVAANGTLSFSDNNNVASGAPEAGWVRDASNVIAQKNSTNAQAYRLYFSTTGPVYQSWTARAAGSVIAATGGANQISYTQTTPPTCSSNCGTSPSVVGSDIGGIVTMGGTGVPASGFVITFNGTWPAAPACTIIPALGTMAVGKIPIAVVTTTTTITVTTNGVAPSTSDKYAYHCDGVS